MGTAADPIGDSMDDDIQRRLYTFSRIWARLDYKFIRVGVKPEHVQEYDLPEDPDEDTAKRLEENDSRTRRFKAKYGKLYAVELYALAGKEPEEEEEGEEGEQQQQQQQFPRPKYREEEERNRC